MQSQWNLKAGVKVEAILYAICLSFLFVQDHLVKMLTYKRAEHVTTRILTGQLKKKRKKAKMGNKVRCALCILPVIALK